MIIWILYKLYGVNYYNYVGYFVFVFAGGSVFELQDTWLGEQKVEFLV